MGYSTLPQNRARPLHISHDCGVYVLCALDSINKQLIVVDSSLLGRYSSIVVMYGRVGIQPIPHGGNRYPTLPYRRSGASHIFCNCGTRMVHVLESITKDVVVLDMSQLGRYRNIIGVYGSGGIQPIPHRGEIDTPHSYAGEVHLTLPTTVVSACLMHCRASQRM